MWPYVSFVILMELCRRPLLTMPVPMSMPAAICRLAARCRSLCRVDVLPPQAAQLAAPQAGERGQVGQRVEPLTVGGDGVEELGELLWLPDLHLAPCARRHLGEDLGPGVGRFLGTGEAALGPLAALAIRAVGQLDVVRPAVCLAGLTLRWAGGVASLDDALTVLRRSSVRSSLLCGGNGFIDSTPLPSTVEAVVDAECSEHG
jgi:hypothetical protein